MGRKSQSGGVKAKGRNCIEFTIFYQGKRFRPTLERTPSEANLRRARVQLADINRRILAGSFNFAEEFPDYRYLDELKQESDQQKATCGEVFDRFIAHCSLRVAMNDMALAWRKSRPLIQPKRKHTTTWSAHYDAHSTLDTKTTQKSTIQHWA